MDAARGDVGRDERLDGARVERVEVAHASVLRQVAVQVDGGNAAAGELLSELLRAVLGAGEHDRASGCGDEVGEHVDARVGVDGEDVVLHRRDGRLRRIGLVRHRVRQELLDEHVDATVERRGEQQVLRLARHLRQDAFDAGQEAHVGHVVGLVEDADLDVGQVAEALAHEVFQTPGARDEDVDARLESLDLRVLPDAAEDGRVRQPGRRGQRLERVGDLVGELARRREDERARAVGVDLVARLVETGDERQQERERLARAGTAAAEDVAALERVGQRRGLDGCRRVDAELVEGLDEDGGHAEIGERGHR